MTRNEKAPRITIAGLRIAATALERHAASEPAEVSDAMLRLAAQARVETGHGSASTLGNRSMLMVKPDMDRKAFLARLKRLGLKQRDFAAIFGTNPQVVSKWGATFKGAVGIPYWVGPALDLMETLKDGGSAPQASLLLVPQQRKARH